MVICTEDESTSWTKLKLSPLRLIHFIKNSKLLESCYWVTGLTQFFCLYLNLVVAEIEIRTLDSDLFLS